MKGVVFLGDWKPELREFPDPTPGPRDAILDGLPPWSSRTRRVTPRDAGFLQVEDVVVAETGRVSLGELHQRSHDGADTGAANPRRAKHDACVRPALLDSVTTERTEIPRVSADQAPALPRGEDKLCLVTEPDVAYLVGADGVHAPRPQRDSNRGRQVLVEVEPHTWPAIASCIARPSAWAATLSVISASISCRYLP